MHTEILKAYCNNTGVKVEDILAKKTDRATVLRRNAILYLTWEKAKKTITHTRKKTYVLAEVATAFGMKRVNAYEQISIFETNLILPDVKRVMEEVKSSLLLNDVLRDKL